MSKQRLVVNAPLLTPVDADFVPDPLRLAGHARSLIEEGCDSLTLFGTTGEANSFSAVQRMAALEGLLEEGVPAERLFVGTGCPALADTVALTRHAVGLGCTRILALPPYYYKNMSDEGLFASYSEVLERVGSDTLALYLYHFPRMSGVPVTDGLIERLLAAYPGTLAGIKDSSGDRANLMAWLARYPGLAVFPGNERRLPEAFAAGAPGVISAVANVNAAAMRELADRWAAGEADLAALEASIHRVRDIFESVPTIPALKRVVAERTGDGVWERVVPPHRPLPAETAASLLDALRVCRPQILASR